MSKLIAHSANKNGKVQVLEEHLFNVAYRVADTLNPVGLPTMGWFIGLLHDVGKAQDDWQSYIRDPAGTSKHPGHAHFGRLVLNKDLFPLQCDDEITSEYRYAIAQVIYGHHSALYDDVNFDDMSFSLIEKWESDAVKERNSDEYVFRKVFNSDFCSLKNMQTLFAAGYDEYASVFANIRERNLRYSSDKQKTAMRFELNLLNNLLLSALMDADWLDTQRHEDGKDFPELHEQVDWKRFVTPLEAFVSGLPGNTSINQKRAEISQACRKAAFETPERGAYKLSVFCGGGKTLASARYAINHALLHEKRHVFYVIPFTSIIEQNAEVLREACSISDIDGIHKPEMLEHHCNAGLNPNATVEDSIENKEEFSRKSVSRYDMPIIMTTQVRFLESVFSKDKKTRRLFADYINSEVIFDEFQAMPVKLLDMFYIAAEFMVNVMKCNIVLCSATQSIAAQYDLSQCNYLTGVDWNAKYADTLARADFIDLSANSHPDAPVKELGAIGDLALEELQEKSSVLIITNTRQQARDLYFNLTESVADVQVFHLSTNMYPKHRADVLKNISNALKDDQSVICVSTSLIEAGVDLSFESVIRYINGFDNIVQSGGRCNRHGESAGGHVYIVNEPTDSNFDKQQHATGVVIGEYGNVLTNHINEGLALYYSDYISRLSIEDTGFPYSVSGNLSGSTTLTNLWGDNPKYIQQHDNVLVSSETSYLPDHRSMVRTAQKAFEVIGQNGRDVLICRNEHCREWLDAYVNAETYQELTLAQQMLQQYTVNLAFGDYERIIGCLVHYENRQLRCMIEVMEDSEAYDAACGVRPIQNEDLIF